MKEDRLDTFKVLDEVCRVIDAIGRQKVIAIITDNGSNFKSARDRLQTGYLHPRNSEYYKCLSIYCFSHGLNLIMKDLFKNGCLTSAMEIIGKFIKRMTKSKTARRTFRSLCSTSFPPLKMVKFTLPPKICWKHYSDVMKLAIKYERVIRGTAIQSTEFTELNCDQTWSKFKILNIVLQPLVAAIDESQKQLFTIADGHRVIVKMFECKQDMSLILNELSASDEV